LAVAVLAGLAFGNSPPTASITIPGKTQPKASVNENVCFQAVASDPDNDPLKYTWDFGDGSTSSTGLTTPAACHTYAKAGFYIVKLTVDDGYTAPAPKSLLAGMTPANYTLPAGWNLVALQDFECVNSQAFPTNPSCSTLPSSQGTGINYPENDFQTAQNHTPGGSHSYGGLYGGDGAQVDWYEGASAIGSYTSLYVSYWDYADPNAMFGNSDYFEFELNAPGENPGCWIAIDAQWFGDFYTASSTSSWMLVGGEAPGCEGNFLYQQAVYPFYMNAGRWEQHEILITPNTISTPPISGDPPNCNSLTPTSPSCGNGTLQFWADGKIVINALNADLTGGRSYQGAPIILGNVITSFDSKAETKRCTAFSSTGGGTCPGTQPGTGAPQPFHRYFDDIIIMKK
jgi:hypothetical protein